MVEAMRAMGAPAAAIEQAEALAAQAEQAQHPAEQPCNVWPENWPTLQAFLGVCSQWRLVVGATSVRTGLIYEGVRAWLAEQVPGRRRRHAIWQDLLVMERAVLQADQEIRAQEKEG